MEWEHDSFFQPYTDFLFQTYYVCLHVLDQNHDAVFIGLWHAGREMLSTLGLCSKYSSSETYQRHCGSVYVQAWTKSTKKGSRDNSTELSNQTREFLFRKHKQEHWLLVDRRNFERILISLIISLIMMMIIIIIIIIPVINNRGDWNYFKVI